MNELYSATNYMSQRRVADEKEFELYLSKVRKDARSRCLKKIGNDMELGETYSVRLHETHFVDNKKNAIEVTVYGRVAKIAQQTVELQLAPTPRPTTFTKKVVYVFAVIRQVFFG